MSCRMIEQSCGNAGAAIELLYATVLHSVTVSAVPSAFYNVPVSISQHGVPHWRVGGDQKLCKVKLGHSSLSRKLL